MRAATIAVWTAYGKLFRAAGWTYSKFKQENLGYLRQSEDMASDIALRLASEIEQHVLKKYMLLFFCIFH